MKNAIITSLFLMTIIPSLSFAKFLSESEQLQVTNQLESLLVEKGINVRSIQIDGECEDGIPSGYVFYGCEGQYNDGTLEFAYLDQTPNNSNESKLVVLKESIILKND